ncbi:MAG TPA: hemerythrin domain-containing protein [Kofleriaceae bacterium]|nr:hemerythrin domain-containing protein [Kofleriaceae bacterium]
MNAIAILERQHALITALLDSIEQADDPDEKRALFQELADHLAAHATIEEEIFYPAAFWSETDRMISQSMADHLELKLLLAEMLQLLPEADGFAAKIEELRRRVDDHVLFEEHQLFEEVEALMDMPHLEQLGRELHHRFEEEIRATPRDRLIIEAAEAAGAT